MINAYSLTVIAAVFIAFCAGIMVSMLGTSVLRPDSKNVFVRLVRFIKAKSGYLASFAVGALVMGLCAYNINPFMAAQWSGVYQDAILGSLIRSDETILQTGQIPQDMLDWYQQHKQE